MLNNRIGIWGFGTVGKAALAYFVSQGYQCSVMDKRAPGSEEMALLEKYNASFVLDDALDLFFSEHDIIFASPGIDINPYRQRAHFICELDIFAPAWHKPIIAVTGTVGKTSTTTLLGNLLAQSMRVAVGGNIGTAMLSFLNEQQQYDCAVLELSSWQLEHTQPWAPDIAVWTNFSPNHLDRHKTMHAYFNAKLQIMLHQTAQQTAILPLSLREQIAPHKITSKKIWIADNAPTFFPEPNEQALYIKDGTIFVQDNKKTLPISSADILPNNTYIPNGLATIAVLHTLGLPIEILSTTTLSVEHRLECVGMKNNITFYNDSKATVPESTLAAVAQFKKKNIILFLGGLSKGVDRIDLIRSLPPIKKIICFGKEADLLHNMCTAHSLASISYETLESAFDHAIKIAAPDEIVLFSPSGSSFDLYTDYAERGRHFKQLVNEHINN